MTEIRKAEIGDIDKIIDIKIKGWKKTYKDILDKDYLENISYGDNYKKFKKEIEDVNSKKKNIVIIDNNEIVGYSKYSVIDDDRGQIYAIYVRPDVKNCGYGTQLLEYIMNIFRDNGCKNMILWCIYDNTEGKNFYTRKGGKEGSTIKSQIGNQYIDEISFIFEL